MFDAFAKEQVVALAARFGEPLVWEIVLENEGLFDPLGKTDRYGEVCMVVRRPSGRLLAAKKTFYPPGAYRLLTGGIHHGEPILDALLRETVEETGLETRINRFLAVIDYLPHNAPAPASGRFATFAFLLDEIGGTLECLDPGERLEEFREISVDDLPAMAEQLESLGREPSEEIAGRWRDWGRFRAVVHRAVYEALKRGAR